MGSVERANRDLEDILACWMRENNASKWGEGLRFVQSQKNNRLYSGIGITPFNAMFGENRYSDLSGNQLPNDVWQQLEGEEDLAEALGVGEEEEEGEVDGSDHECYETDLIGGISDIVIRNKCSVCDVEYEGSTQCSICDTYCHDAAPCLLHEKVNCQLCKKKESIDIERNLARSKQAKQAERMLSATAKRYKPAELGETVMVPVPDVDRGRSDFRSITGVITNVGQDGTYSIGTKHGVLKQSFVRSEFIPSKGSFLNIDDVPENEVTTVRKVARIDSLSSGQGFQKCTCVGDCSSNRCSCRKTGQLCNSKCHNSLSCKK